MSFYVSTASFFLLHCDEWDRVVALPRHKFVTGATLLQLVIGTDGIGSCKSNYYTITTTTTPFFGVCFSFFFYILEKNVVMQVCNTFFFTSVMQD